MQAARRPWCVVSFLVLALVGCHTDKKGYFEVSSSSTSSWLGGSVCEINPDVYQCSETQSGPCLVTRCKTSGLSADAGSVHCITAGEVKAVSGEKTLVAQPIDGGAPFVGYSAMLPEQFAAPGDSVTVSWQGAGSIPGGSVQFKMPAEVTTSEDISMLSLSRSASRDFLFSGSGSGNVKAMVYQAPVTPDGGFDYVLLECEAPVAGGKVTLPSSALKELQVGPVSVLWTVESAAKTRSGDYEMKGAGVALLHGPTGSPVALSRVTVTE